ncbi:MAG: sulfur carrier protein ThiS adenylyltransferase ThiF [Planctomycetes bacterium]|nr:sulfur carrier protein ThiS adenylyltransferase ThiF [Planctomycetota bacterium]
MRVNEKKARWFEGLTLAVLRAREDPKSDLIVLNGYPVEYEAWDKTLVKDSDDVVLIRRGEIPTAAEMRAWVQSRHSPGVADVLAKATVGIAGVGGLGSHVAHALARTGIGKLVLADFDVVEPSNLNRQMYRLADIGIPKVDAIAADLSKITPLVKTETHEVEINQHNITGIFGECQIVAECFDRPEFKQMIVETVLTKMPGKTIVAASGLAGTEDSNIIKTRKVRDRFFLVGDETTAAAQGMGLMAPRVMVAAGHQANAIVRILLGEME